MSKQVLYWKVECTFHILDIIIIKNGHRRYILKNTQAHISTWTLSHLPHTKHYITYCQTRRICTNVEGKKSFDQTEIPVSTYIKWHTEGHKNTHITTKDKPKNMKIEKVETSCTSYSDIQHMSPEYLQHCSSKKTIAIIAECNHISS